MSEGEKSASCPSSSPAERSRLPPAQSCSEQSLTEMGGFSQARGESHRHAACPRRGDRAPGTGWHGPGHGTAPPRAQTGAAPGNAPEKAACGREAGAGPLCSWESL